MGCAAASPARAVSRLRVPEGYARPAWTHLEDAQGRIWARTSSDLFGSRRLIRIVVQNVRSLDLRPDGEFRVTSADGIGRLEGDRVVLQRRGGREGRSGALLGAGSGTRGRTARPGSAPGSWAAWSGRGLVAVRGGGPAEHAVTALCRDRHGALCRHHARPRALPLRAPAVGRRISSPARITIYEDREGSLWVDRHRRRPPAQDGLFTPVTAQDGRRTTS